MIGWHHRHSSSQKRGIGSQRDRIPGVFDQAGEGVGARGLCEAGDGRRRYSRWAIVGQADSLSITRNLSLRLHVNIVDDSSGPAGIFALYRVSVCLGKTKIIRTRWLITPAIIQRLYCICITDYEDEAD